MLGGQGAVSKGVMTRRFSAVALTLGLLACAPVIQPGDPCVRDTDCPSPLVCLYGRCRDECTTYLDCDDGEACLRDGSGAGACRTPVERTCDTSADCGELACVERACVQPCVDTEDCGGTVCTASPGGRTCVDPTGDACVDGSECAFGVCRDGYCDPVRSIAAGSTSTCVLLESGRIACTGANEVSLISPAETPWFGAFRPVVDEELRQPPFEALDLGSLHACAMANGEVRCWGGGSLGQNLSLIHI